MSRDLERAAERFADSVHEDVAVQVQLAWALERDRLYDELASLTHRVAALEDYLRAGAGVHSVKVQP